MNYIHKYYCLADFALDLDFEQELFDADNGQDSSINEGKEQLLNTINFLINKLYSFREDVKEMSFKKFEKIYN